MGALLIALTAGAATVASPQSAKGPPPSDPCAAVAARPDEAEVRPVRVFTQRHVTPDGRLQAIVKACMVAPRRERANVNVGFELFEQRGHWWGEDGQDACRKPGDFARAACHDDHWLAGAAVNYSYRQDVQTSRLNKVLVIVNWRDCNGPASVDCAGTDHRQAYLLDATELSAAN